MPAKRKDSTPPPDPLYLALGERISALRTGEELPPAEFAARMGMDVNYLWRVERGRQNLSFRNVARFAKAFGLTLPEFLQGIDVADIPLESRPYSRRTRSAVGD